MLWNYIKISLRNLYRQKGFAFINIFGLAIGLTCFILIGLFVRFELSYDTFHNNADDIYRIVREKQAVGGQGNDQTIATPSPLVKALMDEVPEVAYAAQFSKAKAFIDFKTKRFQEEGIYATEHFFQVFSFPLLHGDAATALADPDAIVLTESLAKKYFGEANPIGQTLTIYTLSSEDENDNKEMKVTAVVADVPDNSHFTFDYLVPVTSSQEHAMWLGRWESNGYLTYARLHPNSSYAGFTSKLSTLAQTYLSPLEFYQQNPGDVGAFIPQALTDIHLHSHLGNEFSVNGDIKYIYLFSAIALMILLIACINYINLATARSVRRAMEVGVRKVMGAHRSQLIGQFMSEAIMPAILALFIAMALVVTLLPTFNGLTARSISLEFHQNGGFLALLLFIGLGVGVLAGSYPALMMSSFSPVRMMKGMLDKKAGKTTFRNTLVVVQFAITMVLLVGTIVIQRQLHYIESARTGIERDQIIVVDIEDRTLFDDRYTLLKQTLQGNPNVMGVTAAQTLPTNIDAGSRIRAWQGAPEGDEFRAYRSIIQHDFVDIFGLEVVEGRDFSEAIAADARNGLLINETMKRRLGWETAVGKWVNFHGEEVRVVGVLKDYNFHSFHQEIAPLGLFIDTGWWFAYQRVFVKVRPENMQETIAFVGQTLADISPGYPFDYHFLDDAYNQMYQTEARLGSLLSYFTFLALFIACMGLLGLATFIAQQRTKEIGVRKVLGASLSDILVLLSKDFTRLVIIAFVLAAPIGYLAQSRWLETFAYRVSTGWGTFAIAGCVVLLLAWLTVSYQSIRVGLADPVKSLRHE